MSSSTGRHVIIVDCETNGKDLAVHEAVEVAWWNLNTDERGRFIPRHEPSKVLAVASIEALRINRYVDRIATADQDQHGNGLYDLSIQLHENTLAGSNPSFDAQFLWKLFHTRTTGREPKWHHRMWDLAPYAAGVLELDHLPGLAEVCDRLAVGVEPDHSAEGDVLATGLCFRALFAKVGVGLS